MTASARTDELLPGFWVNGARQPTADPHVSAADRGLTLADGVFETMRAQTGTVFRLDRHLARLMHALTALDIPAPRDLREQVLAAMQAVSVDEAAVRLIVTRGVGAGGVAPAPASTDSRPTVIVAVTAPPVFPASIYDVGLTIHIASGRRNEYAMTAGLKTLAYTDAVAALLEARRAGADEALFLDTEGHCSEATSSNLFVWDGRTLVTPPVSCGALPGITRAAILDLAVAAGVQTAERAVGLEELMAAEEAFLTSSLRGIAPVVHVAEQVLGRGAPGALTRQLAAAYTALVAEECRED